MPKLQLRNFIELGGIPKELPPAFTYSGLSKVVRLPGFLPAAGQSFQKVKSSDCSSYSIPKGHGNRRVLSLPNPAFHVLLMKEILDHWSLIKKQTIRSPFGLSAPTASLHNKSSGRFAEPRMPRKFEFLEHIERSTRFRVMLELDLAHFYPSVYTHSIEWSMVGKDKAKMAHRGQSLKPSDKRLFEAGKALDLKVRALRGRETVGLPIGPDSSFVLAELVASRLDIEIKQALDELRLPGGMAGHRFFDDYRFYFSTEEEAARALDSIAEVVSAYHLRLNEQKTRIVRLPVAWRERWVDYFASFDFQAGANREPDARRLNLYISEAFRLQDEYPNEGVLNYALSRFLGAQAPESTNRDQHSSAAKTVVVPHDYRYTFMALLCQSFVSRPDTAARVFAIIQEHNLAAPSERKCRSVLQKAVCSVLRGSGTKRHHELLWGLTMALAFGLDIKREWKAVTNSDNAVVILAALDYRCAHAGQLKLPSTWTDLVKDPGELYTTNWILAYEAVTRGWLRTNTDHVANDPFFGFLKKQNVTFYRAGLVEDTGDTAGLRSATKRMISGLSNHYPM